MAQWFPIYNKNELKPGQSAQVGVEEKILALFNLDGKFYAIDDTCTHAGASLAEGTVSGSVVTCPWHGATFDITTGAVLSEPAYEGVKAYKIKVEGNEVLVEI